MEELLSRHLAFDTLYIIYKGKTLDAALDRINDSDLPQQDKAFARNLVMTVLRRNGEIEHVLSLFMKNKNRKLETNIVLKMGVVQLLYLQTPVYAAVNTSVELIKNLRLTPHKDLINAVLRNIERNRNNIQTSPLMNLPKWLPDSIRTEHTALSLQKIPLLDLTVKSNPESWAEKLQGKVLRKNSIRLTSSGRIDGLDGYKDGEWWVQDFSAAIPATLFPGNLKGKSVADFCASPGGKTAQLLLQGATVDAFDISPVRIKVLRENLKRLKLEARIINSDPAKWLKENPKEYDYILLDAPCSASGTVRKNPDILLQERPNCPLKTQKQLLKTAFRYLKKGGTMVYCVCSVLEEEGSAQISAFLSSNEEAVKVPVSGFACSIIKDGDLHINPDYLDELGGVDGFYTSIINKH